ncbi:unnamed protein product [Ilex paraguariensis]|uniref:Smr domain-containing protein n=1 Tax=Ilex paraguariensis TaxID=185542 RepID=A0ABC8URE9_9AQUA
MGLRKLLASASRHSKASRDAYVIGDHLSAQQFSLKAQEEWKAVERLNAKAAKEILSIRNFENDVWKLDLHGLHAMEAVQALRDHLQMIESQVPLSRFVSPKRDDAKSGFLHSASLKSLSHMDVQKLDKQEASYRHRPTSLEVITGMILYLM